MIGSGAAVRRSCQLTSSDVQAGHFALTSRRWQNDLCLPRRVLEDAIGVNVYIEQVVRLRVVWNLAVAQRRLVWPSVGWKALADHRKLRRSLLPPSFSPLITYSVLDFGKQRPAVLSGIITALCFTFRLYFACGP